MCHLPLIRYILFCLLFLCFTLSGYGQTLPASSQNKTLILLEGLVVDAKDNTTLPQAHVINQTLQRGTVTDNEGAFSLLVYLGDSLTVSYVGYLPVAVLIPEYLDSTYHFAEIALLEDTVTLDAVEVRPFPSKSELRQSVMAMPLPAPSPTIDLSPRFAPKPLDGVGNMLADAQQKIRQTAVYQATSSPITFFYNKFNYQARQKRQINYYRKQLGLPEGKFID